MYKVVSAKNNLPTLLVLAGGFGTRLRSAVSDVPKTLAPVAGVPFLEYLLVQWLRQGVQNFIFLLHYEADQMISYLQAFAGKQNNSVAIEWIVEPTPLGTGGSVANAIRTKNLQTDFLVANSDTWLSSGIREIIALKSPAIALVEVENSDRYGQVRLAGAYIAQFIEKRRSAGKSLINAGLYHLDPGLFSTWDGKAFSLENDLFPFLAAQKRLLACPINADFTDIGIPEDYKQFIEYAKKIKLVS